jgi:putative ABC transport system permease protein
MQPHDIRYAFRVLRKDAGFTTTAVLTLALGIGAATTIFSVVNTVLLEPLGYRDPGRLVLVRERIRQVTPELLAVPAPDVPEFQKSTDIFAGAAGWESYQRDLSSDGGQPARTEVTRATANLFGLLGASPALGRTFTPDEDRLRQRVAVLSNALWRTRYASDPNIPGRKVLINRIPHTVIGVMPADFVFPPQGLRGSTPAALWVPMAFSQDELAAVGDNFNYNVIGRLRSNVTMDQANAVLVAVARRIFERFPPEIRKEFSLEAVAVPLLEEITGHVRTLVLLLAGAVLLLLLIACGNVANLLLSRAAAREREFAIRAALGAGRWAIVRQWLTESLLLSGAGGLLGLLLALYGTGVLARLNAFDIPRLSEVHVDVRVLWVSVALSVLTALMFGTVPAFFTAGGGLTGGLKAGGRSAGTRRRHRVRSLLVLSEVALALTLMVGAGLLLRSFLRVRATDPGFRPENVLSMSLSLPASSYPTAESVAKFYGDLDRKLRAIPGVLAAGSANGLPTRGTAWARLFSTDNEVALKGTRPPAAFSVVYGDYLQAMGIPLKRGRLFSETDRNSRVVIVSEGTARQLWPGADPVGRHMKWGPPQSNDPWYTVIGVVGDVTDGSLDHPRQLHCYALAGHVMDQTPVWVNNPSWVVRSTQDPASLASAARLAIASVDPTLAVANLETMEQAVAGTLAPRRLQTCLIGLFAGAAVLLAAIGIYGLIAYSVTQRTQEIGIRVALGATRRGVAGLVMRQALILTALGIAVGALLSLALTRTIASLLFGVTPTDGVTFGVVATVLLLVAVAATLAPARRAMRVDPMTALRRE